jgi:hypothetical protein
MLGIRLAGLLVCAWTSLAAAQAQEIPDGWYLHDELSPSLDLVYYDVAARDHELKMSCSEGFAELLISFYPDTPMPEREYDLSLRHGDLAVATDARGTTYNDQYSIEGVTTMNQSMAQLLSGEFSVWVDGVTMKSFNVSEETKGHVSRFVDACLIN